MASINTLLAATTKMAEKLGVPPKPTLGTGLEWQDEVMTDEEESEEDEEDEEIEWSGVEDYGEAEEEEEEEEEGGEGGDGEEEEESDGEPIDDSDCQRWKDLPEGHYTDRAENFNAGALLKSKFIHIYTSTTAAESTSGAKKNRYGLLFRVSGPRTGQGKAGKSDTNINYDILNTEDSVIPHRFARRHVEPGKRRGHKGLLKMPRTRLIRMLKHHTFGMADGRSEVSSWTHSLLAAINFAEHVFMRDGKAKIHIIDTTQVTNDIFHNADLRMAFGCKDPVNKLFPTEWIVHGIVDGPGYWVVKFRKIRSLLPPLRLIPTYVNGFPYMGFHERQEISRIIATRLVLRDLPGMRETCNTVATTMMKTYKAQDTPTAKTIHLRLRAMLYCLRPRWNSPSLQRGLSEDNNRPLIEAIGDLTHAPALKEHPDIMNDDVFTHEDFPDVTQARAFLRMLATSTEAARQVDEASRNALKRKREDDASEKDE